MENTKNLILPSPFPKRNRETIIVGNISTKFRNRDKSIFAVADTIRTTIFAKKGNYLIFFPSYKYLQSVMDILETSAGHQFIAQERSMSEDARDNFLKNFSNREDSKPIIAFAVMGGIFGEGIDLVGDKLIGVIVVGVGLPQICLERNLIKDYFNENEVSGFEFSYVYPGMNRVLQAAGRVIRTEKDRGVVILIDERFLQYQYKKLFPKEWSNLIKCFNTKVLEKKLLEFWSEK